MSGFQLWNINRCGESSLFVVQRVDRVELRSAHRGPEPEGQAYACTKRQSHDRPFHRHMRGEIGHKAEDIPDPESNRNTDELCPA